MTYTSPKLLTFEAFVEQYGDNPRYELIDGDSYELRQFRLGETIVSPLFPALQLKLDDVMP